MTNCEMLELAWLRYEYKIGVFRIRLKHLQNKHLEMKDHAFHKKAKDLKELIDKCVKLQLAIHSLWWDTRNHGDTIIPQWRNY